MTAPKRLTPQQKAAGTNTYYARIQLWHPDGSRTDFDLPWINHADGKRLMAEIIRLYRMPESKTAAEWEYLARSGLEEQKEIQRLERAFKRIPKVKDTGWVQQGSSQPQRGIYDNAREIEFKNELSALDLDLVKKYLANDAYITGKGWTGVTGYRIDARPLFVYRFTTTWDSSD